MDVSAQEAQKAWNAMVRLFTLAKQNTEQSRRIADFLLAWQNADAHGGWNPTDLWEVDPEIADDILTSLRFIRFTYRYPRDLGFEMEIAELSRRWRGAPTARAESAR